MTNEQFYTLVKLMRGKPESPSNRAARLVIVEGVKPSVAAAEAGCTRMAVHNTVNRYRLADAAVRKAYVQP